MQEDIQITKLQKDKRRAEGKGNFKEVAALCNKLGELLSRLGQYEDAVSEHETELRIYEDLNDWLGIAVAHRRVGECLNELGNYENALQHQQQYLELAQKGNCLLEQQRAYATLGRIHYQHAEQSSESLEIQQSLKKAEAAFQQSLALIEVMKSEVSEVEVAEMKARVFMNLGLICDFRRDTKNCSDYFQRALHIAEKNRLFEDMYRCEYNLAGIYQRIGSLSQALRFVDMAIKCASVSMRDKLSEKEGLILKTRLFLQLGDLSAAKKCLKKVLRMKLPFDEKENSQMKDMFRNVLKIERLTEQLEETPSEDLQSIMNMHERLGDLATRLTCHQMALDNYLKMESCASRLNLDDSALIPVYISIAETYNDLQQYKAAIEYFKKELICRQGDHEQECRTWLTIANIQEQEGTDYLQIKETLETALQNAEKAKHKQLQVLVLDSLKTVQVKYGDKDGGEETERKLEKLCAEHNLNLDDLSEQLSDDKHQEIESGSSDEDDFDLDDSSDSDCIESAEKSPSRKQSMRIKLNEKGETPLHRACIAGNLRKVMALVGQGHPINPRDYCGWLPLHEAANHGFVEIVEYLLDRGARIDDRGGEKCGGITPLHDACSCGNLPVIEVLVNRGATLNVRDDQGNTPLDSLVEYCQRSQEELTAKELQDIRAMEEFLRKKMKGFLEESSHHQKKPGKVVTRGGSLEEVVKSSVKSANMMPAKDNVSEVRGGVGLQSNPLLDDIRYLHDPTTTSKAYRKTISDLRGASHRKLPPLESLHDTQNPDIPALIPENDVVGDDWLIEDIRSTRQKHLSMNSVYRTVNSQPDMRRSKRKTLERNEEPSRKKRQILDDVSVRNGNGSKSLSCEPNGSSFQVQVTEEEMLAIRSNRDCNSPEFVVDNLHRADAEVANDKVRGSSSNTSCMILRLKIRVANKLLLVPVLQSDEPHTVLWLAKEAADRYYQLYNLRPVLTLSLRDGADLAPNDLISTIFREDEEIIGSVDKWDLPLLHTRYTNTCAQLNSTMFTNVKNLLLDCEHSCNIDLSGLCLHDQHFIPLFKALQCQSSLKELNLQDNRLGDDGANELWQVLSTLPNLKMLNISGNGLTDLSLSSLVSVLDKEQDEGVRVLPRLEKLVMSYNNFGDASSLALAKCISSLKNLNTLCLASCCLTVKFFEQGQLCLAEACQGSNISRLNISNNMIGSTGVELLLRSLNLFKLQSINLSNTVGISQASELLKHLNNYLTCRNSSLEELKLDGCHIKSNDIDDLCRFILSCNALFRLTTSSNSLLKNSDIEHLMTSVDKSHLKFLVFENCSISSPLDSSFIDSINAKLQSEYPFEEVRFSCNDLCDLDMDSLHQIWFSRWSTRAVCNFSTYHVSLTVSDVCN